MENCKKTGNTNHKLGLVLLLEFHLHSCGKSDQRSQGGSFDSKSQICNR